MKRDESLFAAIMVIVAGAILILILAGCSSSPPRERGEEPVYAATTAELLNRHPQIRCFGSQYCEVRGENRILWVVDGLALRFEGNRFVLQHLPVHEIASVNVLTGADAALWPNHHGVVVEIQTKKP